ncbi:MAG: radical SAM protein [Acidobacteria bacterium]|nr:radical SAM protein [Acidobacteriota bacterium]
MSPLHVLLDPLARVLRASPAVNRVWARVRSWRLERGARRILARRDGSAGRLPGGVVFEATMRCNLHCAFCYVGALLNVEGEWREELSLDRLDRAFPESQGLQISLTGGEIFVRKDIVAALDLFRRKRYVCGYLTTNGTAITDERAEALAQLAIQGFVKHISVSIDGPPEIHDVARGAKGTFEQTARGVRRLRAAAGRTGAPLRVSINTTVAADSIESLHRMADVARDLGVDAIGLNHLMYSTPEEVDQTLRILGVADPAVIATYVTRDPGVAPARVSSQVNALQRQCRERGIKFDFRPRVRPELVDAYYTPGTSLSGRCLYPFRHARVGFSGKVYFCPFIRVVVGDLATETLGQVWTSERYAAMRRQLLEHKLFPVCRRCCKVELERPGA